MMNKVVLKKLLRGLVALPLVLGLGQEAARAELNAVDPGPYVAANGFFPAWYQDTNGVGLDLCLSSANIAAGAVPGGAGGAACVLLANPGIFDPALPLAFPTNFPDESFYFMGDTTFTAGGVSVIYVSNLEAAFGGGVPEAGQQITFARIRIRITLPATAPGGNYTVTHPYGVEVFSVAPGGGIKVINATRDIGVVPGIFTGALKGDIGPFLRDASLAPGTFIPSSVPGEFYVGDPNTARPVQGSPFGTNFVRVDGPAGFASVQGNQFTVMGKVHAGALATPLLIERTSYGRTATGAQQDLFVKAPPSTEASVTAFDANAAPVAMTDTDANGAWYGQSANDPTGTARIVSVTATAASGPNTPITSPSPLVDLVTVSRAEYSLAAHTLTVEAASSDEVTPPTLTVNGQTLSPTGVGVLQSATITGLTIPPATVTVTSANGGSDTEQVVVLP
ncbi:MAG TPA: hypothetical protein VF104_10975 [Burkholderiales bacterium]